MTRTPRKSLTLFGNIEGGVFSPLPPLIKGMVVRPRCKHGDGNLAEKRKAGGYYDACFTHRRGYSRSTNSDGQPRIIAIQSRKDYCEQCGFVAAHPCQLDVDHIDGNAANNDPSNLQTLCANCHRLKTQLERDWEAKIEDV